MVAMELLASLAFHAIQSCRPENTLTASIFSKLAVMITADRKASERKRYLRSGGHRVFGRKTRAFSASGGWRSTHRVDLSANLVLRHYAFARVSFLGKKVPFHCAAIYFVSTVIASGAGTLFGHFERQNYPLFLASK